MWKNRLCFEGEGAESYVLSLKAAGAHPVGAGPVDGSGAAGGRSEGGKARLRECGQDDVQINRMLCRKLANDWLRVLGLSM